MHSTSPLSPSNSVAAAAAVAPTNVSIGTHARAALLTSRPTAEATNFGFRETFAAPAASVLKMALDVVGAFVLLVLAFPLLVLIAVVIRMDGGQALFVHQRVGLRGRQFGCLKFRTMVINGNEILERTLASDPAAQAEWAATRKLRKDPRVTWIGGWLRTTSMDELPQLLNVLRLQMSLVGPRPVVESELPLYGDAIDSYLSVRPGLTGLWQVSGRSEASYAQRVAMDVRYARQWNFWLDLTVLFRTIPAVLSRRGAC